MAFEDKNYVQVSAGETSADQVGGQKIFSYESVYADDPTDTLDYMSDNANGFFNSQAEYLRFGSYLSITAQGLGSVVTEYGLYRVISNNPIEKGYVALSTKIAEPLPEPFYDTVNEGPLTFVTGGTVSDVVPYAESEVGMLANFSLNSPVNDVGPPIAHSGIEHIECQAGQIEVFWSRVVTAGQNVNMWFQLRSSTPS